MTHELHQFPRNGRARHSCARRNRMAPTACRGLPALPPASTFLRFNELRAVQLSQLASDLLLAFGYFFGDIDLNNDIEIAALTRDARQAAFAQTKPLSTLCAWRNFQAHFPLESGHKQFSAKHCLPWLDFHLMNQIAAFD